MRNVLLILALSLAPAIGTADSTPAMIEKAMFGEHRSAAYQARNRYRHPVGTLTFFGLRPDMRVIEISPGAGWYSEILAPVLAEEGEFIAAIFDSAVPDQPEYRYRLNETLAKKAEQFPEIFGQMQLQPFSPPQSSSLGAADSVDMIVTFRNAHGWIGDDIADGVFAEMFRVLKPGGVLGVVQHRGLEGADVKASAEGGYVPQDAMVEIVTRAGFILEASSEVNANSRDTRDHPEGVWTLPPSLRLEETDRDKYLAIGESDRMTLKFRKP